ncbi:MAG TPA: SLBB domain-containing protein [Rhizobacter sp.]|nr:SLBB domain-containing protein [Rhizobacter sp.]
MTLSCSRTAVWRFGALTLSGCLAATSALAADESNGRTFNAPAYSPAAAASSAAGGKPQNQGNSNQRNPFSNERPGQMRPAPGKSLNDDELPQRRADTVAPKPSEFQKFVELATGRQLPVFGADFFTTAADSFSPVDNVPVAADYIVGPGDEIMVRAWGAIDVDYRATVDRNGQLNLPKVGSFTVAGVKASELEKHLSAQISRLYTNFTLNVTLGQLRGVKVFVVGPARLPGVYTVSSQSTLLSAVVAAGGPGPNGSMRKVLLRRNGGVVSELDIYEFLVQGDKSKDLQLAAGDVVVFQPVGPRVALTGALDTPAIYELKTAQEPVRDVLRYAGGSPVLANPNKVQVERIDPRQSPAARSVEEFKLDDAGLQKPLRDGDVLTLLAISPQFANAVTLKGHVAQPLRYAYTPGMRIRDLIPDKDALISPNFYRRKNLLVQNVEDDDSERAWRQPGDRGQGQTYSPAQDRDQSADQSRRQPTRRDARDTSAGNELDGDRATAERAKKTPAALFDELNWDYAVVERLNQRDLSTQVIPFNLGKAVLQGDEASNVELLPGDVVTVYSQKDIRVPVARQSRLVSLEGEVGAPGVYQLMPGETLAQLIARSGGFTPQAYVYGLEFTREETRSKQKENLAAAIARLEALSATQSARDAANQRDDASAERGAAVSRAASEAQLTRLRRLEPNGRIALELSPQASSVADLPDVPLERADRIIVPSRPGFVTVAGAVVNSNAFLWKPDRTVDDYLKQAGVDEGAEVSNMFVLRADGTVSHAHDRRGFFGWGSLGSQPLEPGDALVVPSQLDYETWGRALVRNLKDWSQIFAQFGLGAAAVQTLRKN